MFELLVNVSRYFFVFYVAYFLYQGAIYVLIERGKLDKESYLPIRKQQITIVFMHIKSFLILGYAQRNFDTSGLLGGGFLGMGITEMEFYDSITSGNFLFNVTTLAIGSVWLVLFLVYSILIKKIFVNTCPLIWNGVFFLTSISLIILRRLSPYLSERQILWFFVSFGVMLFIPLAIVILRKLENFTYVYLIVGLGLLLSTFVFGTEEFGSARWIQIGSFSFQPSELVNFLYVFYLASVFRKRLSFQQLIIPSLFAVGFVVLLVAQRNLGAALIFFMTYMIIMYVSTGKLWLFGVGMLLFVIGSMIAYRYFGHIQVRVAIWQDPWADVHGTGHQIVQAFFAMGTWGIFGSGLTRGLPGLVPVVARDLPFAAITEEFGMIFAIALIGVYIMIFYRGVHIALRADRRYYSLLAVGFTGMLAFQTFLIMGGTIGFVPLTGVTLIFVSYGGSSVLVSTMMIGIIQWVSMCTHKEKDNENAIILASEEDAHGGH